MIETELDPPGTCGDGGVGILRYGELRVRRVQRVLKLPPPPPTPSASPTMSQLRKGFLKNWFAIEVRSVDTSSQALRVSNPIPSRLLPCECRAFSRCALRG